MQELKIKSVSFRKEPCSRTKAEFEKGLPEHKFTPVIVTEIPKDYDPMAPGRTEFFVKGLPNSRVTVFTKCGYHVGNNELVLETYSQPLEKEIGTAHIKVYY